jgi:hypothetical protein
LGEPQVSQTDYNEKHETFGKKSFAFLVTSIQEWRQTAQLAFYLII